jgi:dihydrofolate reductase
MGRLINTTTMSLDGVIEVGAWYLADGGHDPASRDQFSGIAGMLLGRKTYEGLAGFWPDQIGPWADALNPLPKYVASWTLSGTLDWNAETIEGDAVEGVARLKHDLDGDLVMSGCGELARTLIANGLVDELRFWIHPTVQGDGPRPYGGDTIPMRLLDTTAFDSGVILASYAPPRAAAAHL